MSEGLTLQRVAVRDAYASAAARAELDAEISELTLLAEQHEGQAAGPALDFSPTRPSRGSSTRAGGLR
jgi:hypothetical protein